MPRPAEKPSILPTPVDAGIPMQEVVAHLLWTGGQCFAAGADDKANACRQAAMLLVKFWP